MPRVGAQVSAQLERLGVRTIQDLLRYYPHRYEDLRSIVAIGDLQNPPSRKDEANVPAETNVIGTITHFSHVRLRGRARSKTTASVQDESGALRAIWFGRPYLGTQLSTGMRVFLRGRIEMTLGGPHMIVAKHRVLKQDECYEGELVPIYSQTAALPSSAIARLIRSALQAALKDAAALRAVEPLPPAITSARNFKPARWALRAIHAPQSLQDAAEARRRLIFEEFFVLAAATALRRVAQRKEAAPDLTALAAAKDRRSVARDFEALVPFTLTGAQRRCIDEIVSDMTGPAPMNRLLQGDVGCGKTAVAAAAVMLAARAEYQAAFMAPTEILASQQFQKMSSMLSSAGLRSALLVGALSRKTRNDVLDGLSRGELDLVVGTHALITEDVEFVKLGLVIIDEQHRFGVMQRAALRAKAKQRMPHTLVMTATPIPRTLAQSVYADLDISIIDELPAGRKRVKTYVRAEEDKAKIFGFIRDQVQLGRQAYVVCPAIDESDRALHSAVQQAERLKRTDFEKQRVALLHGRMSVQQKEEVMRLFAAGFVQILITTSVVEVGLDVPNASVMLVLDAQCFGLAQLHQLRGRVGRGTESSYCILMASSDAADAGRLEVLAATNDGFEIAEADLKLRGSGDLSGTRQHGEAELRLAHLIRDFSVFLEAKKDAHAVIASDPRLEAPEHSGLAAVLAAEAAATELRVTS